jgi:hypothetical protein
MSEKSELDLAPDTLEASNQLRRSPNSRNEVFRLFWIDIKSATRTWSCGGGWQLFIVVVEEEKRRGCRESSEWWGYLERGWPHAHQSHSHRGSTSDTTITLTISRSRLPTNSRTRGLKPLSLPTVSHHSLFPHPQIYYSLWPAFPALKPSIYSTATRLR